MTLVVKVDGTGAPSACAACKYQRRKCTSDCPLAPYFPPDQPRQFQNAHRLFGVSNILKILNRLHSPDQKSDAMRSIIYESNFRARYPVHGCLGLIVYLQYQLQQTQLQLNAIEAALSHCRLASSSAPSPSTINDHPFDNIVSDSTANYSNANHIWASASATAALQDYNEISPYFDTIGTFESSFESSAKENKTDLKSPTCFNHTSIARC